MWLSEGSSSSWLRDKNLGCSQRLPRRFDFSPVETQESTKRVKVLKLWAHLPPRNRYCIFTSSELLWLMHLPHSYGCWLSHFNDSPQQGNKDCNAWREAPPCGFKRGQMRSMFLGGSRQSYPNSNFSQQLVNYFEPRIKVEFLDSRLEVG